MQKKLDTALSEEVEELVERKLKEVREKMFEAGMSGLEQFAQFAPIPKDYSDAIKCADLAERGLGVKEGEKEEMVVNFNLLSTPRVVQVDV